MSRSLVTFSARDPTADLDRTRASASSIYDMLKGTDWAENGTPIMYNVSLHSAQLFNP